MEWAQSFLDRFRSLPELNEFFLALTVAIGLMAAWATFGGLRACLDRYTPRFGDRRSRFRVALGERDWLTYRARGRRAWAWTAVGSSFVVSAAYSAFRIWQTEDVLPPERFIVDGYRFACWAIFLWAWRREKHDDA